jgi:hypothetical protein
MSVQTARTGAFAYLRYGWESTFKGGAATRDKVFGRGQRITTFTRNDNPEIIFELGTREARASVFKQLEGSFSVEWILSNPWFFKGLMGTVATSGTGPYTHTYTKTKLPQTLEIEVGMELSGGNVVRNLKGAVISSVTLTSAVGEVIRASADILYADETVGTALSSYLVDTFDPFAFQHATLEIPGGTVLGEVQRFELTINNNGLLVYGLGDHRASSGIWQAFEAAGRLSITMKNATLLNYLRGEQASGKLTIQTSASNKIEINMANLVFGEHSVTVEPNALIIEDLPILVRDIPSIVATNSTATHP